MDTLFLIESQEEFKKAIEDFITNYCVPSSSKQSPKNFTVLKSAKEDLKKLLQDSKFDTNKVLELLNHKDWAEQKIAYFMKLLNEKKSELLYATLCNYNSEYGETITNFDWLLKLVLGTSDLNTLNYPLLQLVLSTESHGTQKNIMYDIPRDILIKLINALEELEEM